MNQEDPYIMGVFHKSRNVLQNEYISNIQHTHIWVKNTQVPPPPHPPPPPPFTITGSQAYTIQPKGDTCTGLCIRQQPLSAPYEPLVFGIVDDFPYYTMRHWYLVLLMTSHTTLWAIGIWYRWWLPILHYQTLVFGIVDDFPYFTIRHWYLVLLMTSHTSLSDIGIWYHWWLPVLHYETLVFGIVDDFPYFTIRHWYLVLLMTSHTSLSDIGIWYGWWLPILYCVVWGPRLSVSADKGGASHLCGTLCNGSLVRLNRPIGYQENRDSYG